MIIGIASIEASSWPTLQLVGGVPALGRCISLEHTRRGKRGLE